MSPASTGSSDQARTPPVRRSRAKRTPASTAKNPEKEGAANQPGGTQGQVALPLGKVGTASGALPAADELEMRLARVWFWEGSFARRGINLQRHFAGEPLLVTDLDMLAFEISGQLDLSKCIGEAKSGTGRSAPAALDRCLWLAGLMRLVGAQRAELVTALKVNSRVRDTVAPLGVRALTVEELAQRERALDLTDLLDVGSQGPSAFLHTKKAGLQAKNEPTWERVFWFLRCELWFLEPWQATKRLLGLLEQLVQWWTPQINDEDQSMLRWMFAEAVSVLTLNLTVIAGTRLSTGPVTWRPWALDRLAEGAVPAHHMRYLAGAIDKYLAQTLGHLKAPPDVQAAAMGAFVPVPPLWAESLLDLIERLASEPLVARALPRHVDLLLHERLVHRRDVTARQVIRVSEGQEANLDRMRRLVAAFLRAHARAPEVVDRALVGATP